MNLKQAIRRRMSILEGTPIYDPLRSFYHATLHREGAKVPDAIALWYAPFIRPGDTVFDVGANHGEHTAVMLRLGARVVAVEPNGACARRLRGRFFGRRVAIEETAVGHEVGEAVLHIADSDTLSTLSSDWREQSRSQGRFEGVGWREEVRVPVTTLGELFTKHGRPSFIKIDVEGFEEQVLRGMPQLPAALCYEFNTESNDMTLRCLDLLVERGATAFCIRHGIGTGGRPGNWRDRHAVEMELREVSESGKGRFGDIFAAREVPADQGQRRP